VPRQAIAETLVLQRADELLHPAELDRRLDRVDPEEPAFFDAGVDFFLAELALVARWRRSARRLPPAALPSRLSTS
jgi:hypothetical protein